MLSNTIITVSSDPESIEQAVKIADDYPMVYATVGLHPHDADKLNNEILKRILN